MQSMQRLSQKSVATCSDQLATVNQKINHLLIDVSLTSNDILSTRASIVKVTAVQDPDSIVMSPWR
jgi:hypothetical protein